MLLGEVINQRHCTKLLFLPFSVEIFYDLSESEEEGNRVVSQMDW